MYDSLPDEIKFHLDLSSPLQKVQIGQSGDECFRVRTREGRGAFLKSHLFCRGDFLSYEVEALKWLKQFVPVPEVLAWAQADQHEFLLCTALPGKDLFHSIGELSPQQIVRLCARSMRMLHEIPMLSCPFDQRLSIKVTRAKERAVQGQIDLEDLDFSRKGWSSVRLVRELELRIPTDEDLVFTHGDFSLPNIIAHAGELSGFVDLSRCGIADRHQDIALCLKSLEWNLGDSFRDLFLRSYGWDGALDDGKLAFYELLDEFF